MEEKTKDAPVEKQDADKSEPLTIEKSDGAPAQVEAADVDLTGGVEDGVVEKTSEAVEPEKRDRIEHEEKVVHDFDEEGNIVGFHKEPADGSTPPEQESIFQAGQEETDEENK